MRLLGLLLTLFGSLTAWATDSNINDTSATSHEIQFCSGLAKPYTGCLAANLRIQADNLASPVAIYEYVRNNYDFTLYHGARSGSINSFAGMRGNDVDLAATLISMLRSQGVPSRYVVGTVHVPSALVENWLSVENVVLAASLLNDQGIQNVVLSADSTTIDMEHVWVEALIPYDEYRGTGAQTINCTTSPTFCHWVPLDPAFKQHQFHSSGLDPYSSISFDYTSYYNAILNSDNTRKDKNPLEIYQNQVMAWLQTNAPGKGLTDIPDFGAIVPEQDGLLPASLPYLMPTGSTVRRYNSVADHDAAVPATEPKKWLKTASIQVQIGGSTVPGGATISLVDASTQRLTFTFNPLNSGYTGVFRLDNTATGTAVNATGAATVNGQAMALGTSLNILVSMDGSPGVNGAADYIINATYNAVIGGYYLVATGGETSNWGQVHVAAQKLLAANQQYPIVYNAAEIGCTVTTGMGCTPYVDIGSTGIWSASDPKLVDSQTALDALSGGLLEVAAQQYYAKLRDDFAQLDAINRMRTPIVGFLGVVSATHSAQYLDGTAFAIEPGGLLIDMKGITNAGCWRIDQPSTFSNTHFELSGHILSSLEHETWQELTGFDAISTMRGIQISLANGGSLLNFYRDASTDTFPTLGSPGFGFATTVPAGFTLHTYSIFGQNYESWSYSGSSPTTAGFEAMLANSLGIPVNDYRLTPYTYAANNGIDGFYSSYASLIQQINTWQSAVGQLKTNVTYSAQNAYFVGQDIIGYSVTSPAGFAVGSVTRTATDTYQFVINETSLPASGTYNVVVALNQGNASNTVSGIFNYANPVSIPYLPYTTLAGFSVTAFSQPISTQLSVTVQQTAAHADGTYTVPIYENFNAYPGIVLIGNFNVQISGGRVVDQLLTYTFQFDATDNHQLTCQGGAGATNVTYTAVPSVLMTDLQGCFNNMLTVNNLSNFSNFFTPAANLIYRPTPLASDARLATSVARMRDTLYQEIPATSWNAYRSPSNLSNGSSFSFGVDYLKNTNTASTNTQVATYRISNTQVPGAGGGYVTATAPLDPSFSIDPISYNQPAVVSVLPTFINSTMTDMNTISSTNNNLYLTPSTTDPVSTVTGNNFHDETDFVIKGRAGLNYAFTRTYNSAPSATANDLGLGNGWVHSYGMRLKANDYGVCPNCTPAQAPENGNGKTSSITYTDERGGDHNYLVNETTYAITTPQGEFDSLAFDTPVVGQHTLTFRNGTKYVFQSPTGTLKTTPGITAQLIQIADPWGNQLNFTYNANGRIATVADNLGISNRTGLVFSYDINNHLTQIADWSGRFWQYSVTGASGNGNLASYTNPLTQTISYGYTTGTHNLITVAKPLRGVQRAFTYYQNGRAFNDFDALGNTETLDYDLFRKSTQVTDPRGGIRDYEYDSSGRMTKLTEPDGAILMFLNQADGLRYSKTDGLGYLTQYSYKSDKTFNTASDTFGNVTREQDALNQTIDTTYGIYDQVATVKDKRGTVLTTTFYTGSGTCVAVGKPNTVTISTLSGVSNVLLKSYCWNSDGTPASQTDYLSPTDTTKTRISTYTYDTAAHLNVQNQTVTGWDGTSVAKTYSYDNLGRKQTETLPRRNTPTDATLINLTTTTTWDVLDRAIQVQDPAGNLSINSFDANGQLWQVTNQYKKTGGFDIRLVVTRTFDAADRVLTETDALGGVTTYAYDNAGNVISVTDPVGHTLSYGYDAMNRRTSVTDANGRTVRTIYDLAGHPISVTNGNNETTITTFDAIGQPQTVTDPHGYISSIKFDGNSNPICTIDANASASLQPKNTDGCSVTTQFDELNRPILVRDALNGTTATTYDLLGHPLIQVDAEGRQYAWTYDGLGRPSTEIDFTGFVTKYALDQAGNAYQKTNRLTEITNTTFDVLNRPTNVSYLKDGTSEAMTYDPEGNLNYVANNTIGYSMVYDNLNRLTSKTDSRAHSLGFTWDKSSRIQTKTTYQGSTTSYTYDGAGTLVALSNPDYLTVNYQYDNAGRLLSRTMSSGALSLYTYDNGGWLQTMNHFDATGTPVVGQSYTRDRIGNITGLTVATGPNPGTTSYTLDALYRLTVVSAPSVANDEAFSYDHIGNRLTATRGGVTIGAAGSTTKYYIYNPATQTGSITAYTPTYNNRLKEIHIGSLTGTLDSSFIFDNEGRLSSQSGSVSRANTWDAKGRLATLSNGMTETYQYDPMDYRIGRVGGVLGSTNYFLEGEHLESVEQSGVLTEKYFRGSTIDELVAGFVSQSGSLVPYLFQHDEVMSVAAETNPNGGTQASMAYWAFGETQATSGTPISRLQFTGRENDGTGLYYERNRYLDQVIGRFISEDRMKFRAGINWFAYCANSPIGCNDPTGEMPNSSDGWWNLGKSGAGVVANGLTSFTGGVFIAGGSAIGAAGPGIINQFVGYGVVAFGASLAGKGIGGMAVNAQNMADAWNNQPASLPNSLPRLVAEGYAPGNQAALASADLIDFGTDALALKVPVGGFLSSTGNFVTQNAIQESNWAATISGGSLLTPVQWTGNMISSPGLSVGSAMNVGGALLGGAVNGYSWSDGSACTTCGSVTAGYASQPNTNQVQSVYRKP